MIKKKERNTLDLGCGGQLRSLPDANAYGTDIRTDLPESIISIDHIFDTMPFPDDSFDYVWAYDFLEHIPAMICYRDNGRGVTEYPRIRLLKDIFRVMKSGAIFESRTPCLRDTPHDGMYPYAWAQDPTHTGLPWTRETWNYFTGGYKGIALGEGIDFEFEMLEIVNDVGHLFVRVRKP